MSETSPELRLGAEGGLLLGTGQLGLDEQPRGGMAFLSHLNSPARLRAGGRALGTPETLALLGKRALRGSSPLPCRYHRPFRLGPVELELYPGGGWPGAALLTIRGPGGALVYARDPLPQRALELPWEPCTLPRCDRLVLSLSAATRPSPEPPEGWLDQLEELLGRGFAPILLLSERTELFRCLPGLRGRGLHISAHPAIAELARRARRAGLPLAPLEQHTGPLGPRQVLLWLRDERSAEPLSRLGRTPRYAHLLPGVADERGESLALASEPLLQLPDGRSLEDLVGLVELSGAREVVLHGPALSPLALRLRAQGLQVRSLKPPEQLELPLGVGGRR